MVQFFLKYFYTFASVVHKNNKNNKASVKKQEIFDVIQLQHQCVTDIVFRIVVHLQPLDSYMSCISMALSKRDQLNI